MSKMYSRGSLEMDNLFGDSVQSPVLVSTDVDQHTSFENETESLYMTQLEGLGQLTSQEGKDAMSSIWNADFCGSLLLHPRRQLPSQPSRQPKRQLQHQLSATGSMMAMVRPEDVTGQIIKREPEVATSSVMDEIKRESEVATSSVMDEDMAIVEANFDLSTLADPICGTPLAESTMVEETQETIDDMAAFLKSYEAAPASDSGFDESVKTENTCLADELLNPAQRQTLEQMDTSVPDDDADLAAVEALCDNFLFAVDNGQPDATTAATQQPVYTDILQAAVDSEGLSDSGYQTLQTEDLPLVSQTALSGGNRYSVANVSHCVTPDGQKVIIVVQRPEPVVQVVQPQASIRRLMPKAEVTEEDGDDSDSSWAPSPQPAKRKPGRKRVVTAAVPDQLSSAGKVKKSYKNIKDRKERKKWQNVEAARRYRLKKKQEEEEMEAEEDAQRSRNEKLREQLKDVTSELNTMKKLMKEMGMLKPVRSK